MRKGSQERNTHENGPEVYPDKHSEEELLVHGEDEYEHVVRQRLQVAIQRVECMRCKGGGDYQVSGQYSKKQCGRKEVSRTKPFVVRLMQPLVANRMMFPPMNPVDQEVRKHQETTIIIKLNVRSCVTQANGTLHVQQS